MNITSYNFVDKRMKNDTQLKADVLNALSWEPMLISTEIGVHAKDGIVSLSGIVDCYAKKLEAECTAKKVVGVNEVRTFIEVEFRNSWTRSDAEITLAVRTSLNSNLLIPKAEVNIHVEDGWVTLDGVLPWNYQREACVNAVNYLIGVKGITNRIIIKSDVKDEIEKRYVEDAISRCWSMHANEIVVTVEGAIVTLRGAVSSWYNKEEAARIAWNTPGIVSVKNELTIDVGLGQSENRSGATSFKVL